MRSGTLAIDAASSHAVDSTSAATVVGTGMPIFDACASKKRVAHDCDLTSTLSKACVSEAVRRGGTVQVVLAPPIRIAQDGVGVADGAELLGGLGLAVASVAVGVVFQRELAVFFGANRRVVALGAAEDGVEILAGAGLGSGSCVGSGRRGRSALGHPLGRFRATSSPADDTRLCAFFGGAGEQS